MAAADQRPVAGSAAWPRSDHRLSGHGCSGTSNKRPRQEFDEEGESSPPFRTQQHRGPVLDDEDRDKGCCCKNVDCLWRWGSSSSSSSLAGPPKKSSTLTTASEPSFFHGPLLSVKEHRDRRTGEVRLAVFQGDRRMSVAQIVFSLKRGGGDRGYGYVTSVRVNRDFRGMGLGPLLFKEVFATLGSLSVPEVRLEAEEDTCKHNRLVRYYESLGFRQLEGSKVQVLYNDDQCFRKIPMCRPLCSPIYPRARRSARLADNGPFLLVRLQTKAGGFVRSTADGNVVSPAEAAAAAAAATGGTPSATAIEGLGNPWGEAAVGCSEGGGGGAVGRVGNGGAGGDAVGAVGVGGGAGASRGSGGSEDDLWILVQEVRGIVCFESAYGKYLCVEPDGKVVADRLWDNSWEQFKLERFTNPEKMSSIPSSSDGVGRTGSGGGVDGGHEAGDLERGGDSNVPGALRARDRFALRTYHGQYLSLDAECGTVSASAQPVIWTTDERNAICLCEGAVPGAAPPPASRRQVALEAHLRRMRQKQSVSFVSAIHKRYLDSFGSRGRLSVKYALDLLDRYRDPLASTRMRVSLAGVMVLTAERIRDQGLPDWMQAVGLVHGLGRILHFLGEDANATPTERECVLGEYSWVVGAPFPDSITCPSYNADNDDVLDERYGAGVVKTTGMYDPASGLMDALLCFTGPEYMYMVLTKNGIDLPPQGMAMLRLYPLEPWHAGEAYSALESPADKEMKDSVRLFDTIRRATLHSVTVQHREVNLQQSWDDYLGDLADKFFPGVLEW